MTLGLRVVCHEGRSVQTAIKGGCLCCFYISQWKMKTKRICSVYNAVRV
jgi:hypothetical protein